jgi:LPXTG-motif cell wall-anchored protein
MKRFGLAVLFVFALLLVTPRVWADRGHENDGPPKTSAVEMGAIGLIAASITGAGVYLLRRRRQ